MQRYKKDDMCARMKQNGLVSGKRKHIKNRACAGMNIGRLKKVSGFSDGLFFISEAVLV